MSSKTKTTATMEEAKPALAPKLRFPEFLGEPAWPANQLSNLCALNKGEQLDASDKDANARYPHYNGGISPSSYTQRANREANTIIISEGGNSCGYVQFIAEPFWSGGHCYSLAVKPNVRTLCLFYALQAKQRAIMALRIGSGLPNIQKSTLGRFVVFVPSTTAEQQKIAECLSSVDELMAAQARKVDALKTHKKGLMQQLFPREGETQPRLRFPEFQNAGEWEPETLENLCSAKISYGIVQAGPHVPNGMPYIKSTDLNSELCLDNLARTSEAIAQKYRRSEVVPGDIVFSLRGNIGVAQILPESIPVANLTQGTARIRTKGPPEFYFHALRSPSVNSRIQAVGKGSTFQEISLEALRNIRLFHPKPPEQHRIATCLSSLDALITAETQKHEALKTHKKGLMQQLFPSPEEVEA